MMKMFRKNVSSVLDMNNAKIISQSVVLVSNIKILAPAVEVKIHNPFASLCNDIVLKMILGEQICVKNPNRPPFESEYTLGNFSVINDITPSPRLTLQKKTNTKDLSDLHVKINKIVESGSLLGKYDDIGINYELYFDNDERKIKITNTICKEEIAKIFNDCSIKLTSQINENISLNLTIADAITDGKKIIYIVANFHHFNIGSKSIDEIMKTNFYDILNTKMKEIKF